ncbi:hypothetical protein M3Y99_01363000 [Aphelenchoides fujianensis]|nr:hypothetical protein M3Y99_01363000 [Aphelenchoides fujianensis]
MIAARSSRNRRRLLVASVRDAVVERVGTPDVFLQHFRWAQLQCANAEGNEQTAELPAFDRVHDLLEHVATSDDLELFVLCLVHFGHYSLSRLFFNELDLELLSTLHGRLPLPLPIAPADQTDAAATLGRPETFEFRSLDAHRRLIRCKLDPRPVLDYLRAHFVLSAEQCARIEEADGREEQAERLVDHLRQTAAASQGRRRLLFARFCHALLISGQFDLLAFLDGDEVDWKW